jgi:hypothetical protein
MDRLSHPLSLAFQYSSVEVSIDTMFAQYLRLPNPAWRPLRPSFTLQGNGNFTMYADAFCFHEFA